MEPSKRSQYYKKAKALAAEIGIDPETLKPLWKEYKTVDWIVLVDKYEHTLDTMLEEEDDAFERKLAYDAALELAEQVGVRDEFITRLGDAATTEQLLLLADRYSDALDNASDEEFDVDDYDAILRLDHTLTEAEAVKMVDKMLSKKTILRLELIDSVGNRRIQYLTVAPKSRQFIIDLLVNGYDIQRDANYGSDTLDNMDVTEIDNIKVFSIKAGSHPVENRDGEFFPYISIFPDDLSRYQIYNQEQSKSKDKDIMRARNVQCLIHVLRLYKVPEARLNEVMLAYVGSTAIRSRDLKKIANIIRRDITVKKLGKGYETDRAKDKELPTILRNRHYKCKLKKDSNRVIEIAMFCNHYFMYELSLFTKYSSEHYEEIKNERDFRNISKCIVEGVKKKYRRYTGYRKITSLRLVEKLMEKGYFVKLDMANRPESSNHPELTKHIHMGVEDDECRAVTKKTQKSTKKKCIFYADCETFVTGPRHELYLIGVVGSNDDKVQIFNVCNTYGDTPEQSIVYKFLKYMTNNGKNKDVIVYFHNMKYDYNILERYLNLSNAPCRKGSYLYSVKCRYKGCTIEFRDSYKMLNFPLSKFGVNLDLPKEYRKKEAIAYEYYTKENGNIRAKVCEYMKLLSVEERVIFLNYLNKDKVKYEYDGINFNAVKYYTDYLKLDCLVLKKGFEKFNKIVVEDITKGKMDVFGSLTISSLTNTYMNLEGAFDGCCEYKGNTRAYIAKAVYGGRVCVNKESKKKVLSGKIADYDGVSLYPSAIHRLCKDLGGLPKGKPTRFLPEELKDWKEKKYSILTVKITAVNTMQQMPFITHRGENSIAYLNEAPEKPIVIDSITLEDYIKFHDIKYTLLDGLYWDSGTNPKMGEVIEELFKERLDHKAKGNKAMSQVLKLMMNSAYGKTITKKTNIKYKLIKDVEWKKNKDQWIESRKDNLKNYRYNNFNTLLAYREIKPDVYEMKELCADFSYNMGAVGCAILSMSKRIMNEVFNVANNNGIPIFYTDTDSMHLNSSDVPKLETLYEKKYDRVLTGNQMGQFHVDFELDGADNDQEIYAETSIFLGKKSYIDMLVGTNKKGEKVRGVHYRLKGITVAGLLDRAKHMYRLNRAARECAGESIGDTNATITQAQINEGYLLMYKTLAQGMRHSMLLNPTNKDTNEKKVMFDFVQGIVRTRSEFYREVQFR